MPLGIFDSAVFTITANFNSVNESTALTFTVTVNNSALPVINGTTIYWENVGTSRAQDFVEGLNSGSFIINNGVGTVTFTSIADAIQEGTETLIFRIRTNNPIGPIVGEYTVNLNDLVATTAVLETVSEFGRIDIIVNTSGVADNTPLYWTNIGTTNAEDFIQRENTGTFTVINNTGLIRLNMAPDFKVEERETVQLQIRTGSASGPIVATTIPINVTDTDSWPTPDIEYTPSIVTTINVDGAANSFLAGTVYTFSNPGDFNVTFSTQVSADMYLWGGAGGNTTRTSGVTGGVGGYSRGRYTFLPNTTYAVRVGGGGQGGNTGASPIGIGGGGGGFNPATTADGAAGGGLSGVFVGSAAIGNAIIIAGGGGGGAGAQSVVTTNRLVHLDAGDTSSYPGSGTVWSDLSGNGNNFNIVASAYNSSGPKYMDFNGSFGIAKNSGDISLSDATGVTYIVWTRVKNSTAEWRTLTRSYVNDHHVIIEVNNWNIGMYDNDASGFLGTGFSQQSLPNYNTSNWIAMYWRWQSSSPFYEFSYNDTPGTIRGSISNSNARYNRGFGSIGGYHNANSNPSSASQFWGDIAVCMVYNRRLTDAELMQNFNAYNSRFNITTNLGGPGGGSNGVASGTAGIGGGGGSQAAGGTAGSVGTAGSAGTALTGGPGSSAAGGGGGYYGGGGGSSAGPGAGGGGSGYIGGAGLTNAITQASSYAATFSPNPDSSAYKGGAGDGSTIVGGSGNPGKIVMISSDGSSLANYDVTIQYNTSTGIVQTFTVPPDVYWIRVDARGGGGAGSGTSSMAGSPSPGGEGGRIAGWIPVRPRENLNVIVGGGGTNGSVTRSAGGGGGFSGILRNAQHLISAGGGGGGSGGITETPLVSNGVATKQGGHTTVIYNTTATFGLGGINDQGFSGISGSNFGGGSTPALIGDAGTGGGGGGWGVSSGTVGGSIWGFNGGVGGYGGGGAGGSGAQGSSVQRNSPGGGGGGGYLGGEGGRNTASQPGRAGQGGSNFIVYAQYGSSNLIENTSSLIGGGGGGLSGAAGSAGGQGSVAISYKIPYITNGLFIYLNSSFASSYSGTGSAWYDISGNNNHFTLFNSPIMSGGYLRFNGTNQFARSNSQLNLTSFQYVTVEVWFRLTAPFNSGMLYEHTPDWNSNAGGFGLFTNNNGSSSLANMHHTNHNTFGARNYAASFSNQWTHHVHIFGRVSDPTGRQVYVNGQPVNFDGAIYPTATVTGGNSFANNFLWLASRNGGSLLAGSIAIFRVYNRKLTPEEIYYNYERTIQFFPTVGATLTTTVCGTANESGSVSLTAPPGYTFISITFASYGTPNGSCGAFSIGGCHASNSLSIVQGLVVGKSGTVNIPANNATFGDPCVGTFKRLYIEAVAST